MAKNGTEEIEAGLVDEGGMIDEESGNDVPNGALKEEVRDDQPAMLSPGEFVMPAYAVRYFGVENLVKMLRAAKQGMEQLDDMGLTGEPNSNDNMLASAVLPTEKEDGPSYFQTGGVQAGGVTTAVPQRPTQTSFIPPVPAAAVAPAPVTQAAYAPTVPIRPTTPTYTYPQFQYSPEGAGGGLGVEEYVGPNGEIIYVTTIGGKPIGGVPTGYKKASDAIDQAQLYPITTPPSELKLEDGSPDQAQIDAAQPTSSNDPYGVQSAKSNQALVDFVYGRSQGLVGKTTQLLGDLTLTGRVSKAFAKAYVENKAAKEMGVNKEDFKKLTPQQKEDLAVKNAQMSVYNAETKAADANYAKSISEQISKAESEGDESKAMALAEEAAGRFGITVEPATTPTPVSSYPSVDPSADFSVDAPAPPGVSEPGGGVGGSGYSGASGTGFTPFSKGGLISMSDGGMITVGDKTYSPEDFGFASKGALVKKRKTPAKKKKGKGLASSK